MFDTIVWATDGSELADSTLPLITELAGIHGSKIVAIHINELYRGGRFGGGPVLDDEDDLKQKIAAQVADLRHAGIDAELDVVTSRQHEIAALIAEASTTAEADLIVIATHGRTGPAAILLGSVAKSLTQVAPCPVLTVPTPSEKGAKTGQ